MTENQKRALYDYQTKFNETKQNKISKIVKEKLGAIEDTTTSTPLQKVRLIDATAPCISKTVILSIWNANESYALRENTFLDIRYVMAKGVRGKEMQISAGRSTQLRENTNTNAITLSAHKALERKLTLIAEIDGNQFKPAFDEFDTVGYIFKIDDPVPNQYQSVFIVDAKANIFCIEFPDSIHDFSYDDIVKVNRFIVINNLSWMSQYCLNSKRIPHAFVTELTTFSENPRSIEKVNALQMLKDEFHCLKLNAYLKMCRQKIDDGQANKENSGMNYSMGVSTFNLSKTVDTSINQSKPNDASMNQSMTNQTTPGPLTSAQSDRSSPAFWRSYLSNTQTPNVTRKPFKDPRKQ